jgi:hypothetical protein
MIKSKIALCQPEQKLNSEPAAELRNVRPACTNTFVGGSSFLILKCHLTQSWVVGMTKGLSKKLCNNSKNKSFCSIGAA